MNKTNVFISSTYVDLEHVREHVADFTKRYGLNPICFERGGIYFDWTKPLDESCYKKVRSSHIFVLIIGGRYGSPTSEDESLIKRSFKKYNSVTKKEYVTARDEGIPIYVFVKEDVMYEYKRYINNRKNLSIKYDYVDNPLVFKLIDYVYNNKKNNFTSTYKKLNDITDILAEQWSGMLADYIENKKLATKSTVKEKVIYINGFKLFYYRSMRGLSYTSLSQLSCIDRDKIRLFEKVNIRKRKLESDIFSNATINEIKLLENALSCPDQLLVNKNGNDFISQFVEYYKVYKGKQTASDQPPSPVMPFETKVVFFDFDGTLTKSEKQLTTWEEIWKKLGYDINVCAQYHDKHTRGFLKHQEWCNITRDHFKKKGFSEAMLNDISSEIRLLDGVGELLQTLASNGIKTYIISGSIKHVIKDVLGHLWDNFTDVSANNMIFSKGIITEIIGTPYDFKGKATYIKKTLKENNLVSTDALFVGNSVNDIYASRSGVRTLCVNPHFTNGSEPRHWTHCIASMSNATQILDYVSLPESNNENSQNSQNSQN